MNLFSSLKNLFAAEPDYPLPEFSAAELARLTPPNDLNLGIGGGDFHAIGRDFFRHFTRLGRLRPEHRVLDVGCGCGRMAAPLTKFLDGPGEYHGFDIVAAQVRWAQENIGVGTARFHFTLADVFNPHYHPEGKFSAETYRFPHPDNFFDFIFLTSVFTHLQAVAMENYLANIARCLKRRRRCLLSFFLLNDETRRLIAAGKNSIAFPFPTENGALHHDQIPEAAIAFEEKFIRARLTRHGLKLIKPIHFGAWAGRAQFLSYQDIIVAEKI